MSGTENFRDYPKILRIENDGRIVGLDKNGTINDKYNEKTLNREEFYNTYNKDFGTLHDRYITENLSRTEKYKDSYSSDDINRNNRPSNYTNGNQFNQDLEQQRELKSSKKKNKWLLLLLTVAIVVIGILIAKSYFNSKAEEDKQNELDSNNQQLQRQIDNTKNQLSNSQQNEQQTQSKIDDLQNKINDLKQNNDNESKNNQLQQGIDKLQEAQNSKMNGNESDMKEQLSKVDDVINTDGIKGKAKEQWYNFKTWLSNNISF